MEHHRIEWNNDLDTGIKLIDRQHQEFIGLVNSLHDSSIKPEENKFITDTFSFLMYYVNEHFCVEESAMLAYDYPHYALHKGIHDSFREELNGMEMAFMIRSPTHEIAVKLNNLIINWFMNHIKVEDHNLCKFLEARALEKNEDLSSRLDVISSAFFKGGYRRSVS
ncbi:MAG TPA: hypothetical protein DET40_24385 [Lentisphaeria bacterium]|nr:MAG: hypothetical protein A2X45_00140 [Lentisphaerae bacterium GWF2_50_93]HCE46698.1 hypothetical protein [Lentisphaeria bacterium]